MTPVFVLFGLTVTVVLIIPFEMISVVPQGEKWLIERVGQPECVWEPGLHIRIPILQKIREKVSIAETSFNISLSDVVTKDDAPIHINSCVTYKISDVAKYVYITTNPVESMNAFCKDNVREIIKTVTAEECMVLRDTIRNEVEKVLAENRWGFSITQITLDIEIPQETKALLEHRVKRNQSQSSDALEDARKKGREEGKLLLLNDLVNSGNISSEVAAEKAGMSYGAFLCAVNKLR